MITAGIKELTDAANGRISTISATEGLQRQKTGEFLLVDIRDVRELIRDGMVKGAYHAPRGMLEFWIDPKSPYYKPALLALPGIVFYCAGGLRSALAADVVQFMGHRQVSHIEGGFAALKDAGANIVAKEASSKRGSKNAG